MHSIKFLIYCSLLLIFFNCKKEEPTIPLPPVSLDGVTILACDSEEELKLFFQEKIDADLYLTETQSDTDYWVFIYEDEKSFALQRDCLLDLEINAADWEVVLNYADGSRQFLTIIGDLDLHTELNPFGVSPLCAQVEFAAPINGKVSIRVIGKNGSDSDVNKSFDPFQKEHSIPVFGLYAEYENIVEISFLHEDGREILQKEVQILTEDLRDALPFIQVTHLDLEKMEPGWTLVSNHTIHNPHMPFMIDPFGDIRWIVDYSHHPFLNYMGYDVGMERLQNGHFYFGDWTSDAIYEIDMFGQIINSWPFPGYNFHHNVQEKPDGNFLVTVSKIGSQHLNGNETISDYIIEIDRETGSIIMEWDLKESLDEYRTVMLNDLGSNPIDWIHVNAVIPDPTDNTIIVSGRTQAVVKLDYNNKVKWLFANHQDWGQNRQGDDLNSFLLDAVDANGIILDNNVQNGLEGHPDFDWPWYHHAPFLNQEGNLMIFDNGHNRNFNSSFKYSRAVEYVIDEENMTVQQVWEYGKERGLEAYSWVVSDVDYLDKTNNILISPGCQVQNTGVYKGGKIIELNYDTKEVVYEAELNSSGITFHRTERMLLYPE